ncbi:MAG: TRAP transporter small permease [Desulfobacteraceae bacterium]|nr:TRAP transporter small permease [Desulfobacteraceae bacterium]
MRAGIGSALSALEALSDRVNRGIEAFLAFLALGMSLLISVQVFSRYFLNHSLFWSEEIGRICLVWITFLGASAVYKRNGHLGLDFFVKFLPERVRFFLRLIVLVLGMAFFCILVRYGISFAQFATIQKTAALGLPLAIPYAVIPVSGALFLLHGLSHLLRLLHDSRE